MELFIGKSQKIYAQYKSKHFSFNISYKEKLDYDKSSLKETTYKNYSYNSSYIKKIHNKIIFYTKLSYKHISYYNNKKYDGYLFNFKTTFLFSRVFYLINNIVLFSTDNYHSRIYSYTNDIPTVWNINSYYNRGFEISNYLKYKRNFLSYYFKTSFIKKSKEQKFYIGILIKTTF